MGETGGPVFVLSTPAHESMGNRPLTSSLDSISLRPTESPPGPEPVGEVERHATLAGLLNHYERKAA